jgi:general L-amino acid transport system ATP-binding protein
MPHLDIQRVNKWYGALHVLRDVTLRVRRGERIVICGPSGSGKSTLLRCLNRLEAHDTGRIVVNGTELTGEPAGIDAVRRDVGMVAQQFHLFPHLTIVENCTLAPRSVRRMSRHDARDRAMRCLARVGLRTLAHKYPGQLSRGQQLRAAIARALCMRPRIMLFDEPTATLDCDTASAVLDTLAGLAAEGMTMVCVTHDMRFARRAADRVVFMDAGRIVDIGEPAAFLDYPRHARVQHFLRRKIQLSAHTVGFACPRPRGGQTEAAAALGLSRGSVLRHLVMPSALRVIRRATRAVDAVALVALIYITISLLTGA